MHVALHRECFPVCRPRGADFFIIGWLSFDVSGDDGASRITETRYGYTAPGLKALGGRVHPRHKNTLAGNRHSAARAVYPVYPARNNSFKRNVSCYQLPSSETCGGRDYLTDFEVCGGCAANDFERGGIGNPEAINADAAKACDAPSNSHVAT